WEIFCRLLFTAGIQSILILIDGVDTRPSPPARSQKSAQPLSTNRNSESMRKMVQLAQPLVRAMQEGQFGPQVFTKLFLPKELFLPLARYLQHKQPVDIISWNQERLSQLLSTRMSAATNGAITTLAQLAEP